MTGMQMLNAALSGRYTLMRELGEGGMATVYLALDLKHDRQVALKVLKPDLAAAIGAQRFLKEIQTTARLQHPHIVPLFDSGEADGALFYVMPLLEGESLRDRPTRDTQLPINDAIRIIQQVGGALDHAHRQGVVHRDIKPENILLHDGEALLADFGISVGVRETGDERITGTGLSLGTPQYMSPEQAMGERDIDLRSDIYSLGAVLYEMLAGEAAVTGPSAQAMIGKLMTQQPTSLRVVRNTVSAPVDAAVMRALAKSPTDRFQSAKDFASTLTAPEATLVYETGSFQKQKSRTPFLIGGAVATLLVIAGTVTALSRRNSAATADGGSASIRSIAVMPLDNYSRDTTQDYFAEGMTDELTTDLATISQLRVTSRGSAMQFAGKNRPPTPEIAKKLDVDAIVEGSVARIGDRIKITAQLIDARHDRHLWAKTFERQSADVLTLQSELASAIANEINVRLTSSEQARLSTARPVDPKAHDAYLKGRYFFNRPSDDNLRKAIEQFTEAVRISPTFAPAYSGLSDAYIWAGYNEGFLTASEGKIKGRATAERAVELDSSSAEAHASLATYKFFGEFDWAGCEVEYRRAIALNPNYGFAHDQFGLALALQGRNDESLSEGKRAIAIDPLSPQILIDATMAHMNRKDFPAAREFAKQAQALDPTFFFPVMMNGWVSIEEGKYREAIPYLEKAKAMDAPPFVTAYLAYAYGRSGDRAGASTQLRALQTMAGKAPVLPFNLALYYLGVGENAKAIENLERALAGDSQMMAWTGTDAMFDPLRREPRFVAIMQRMHFAK